MPDGRPLDSENLLVTASHAIFHTEDKKSAPVAVVGYHFQYTALKALFKNITSNVRHTHPSSSTQQHRSLGLIICSIIFMYVTPWTQCNDCMKSCFSVDPDIECFVLDNHGYIIVSKYDEETGRFFGEIHGRLMEQLVDENVYEEVNITDYQAVCYNHINEGNMANILKTVRPDCDLMRKWKYSFGLVTTFLNAFFFFSHCSRSFTSSICSSTRWSYLCGFLCKHFCICRQMQTWSLRVVSNIQTSSVFFLHSWIVLLRWSFFSVISTRWLSIIDDNTIAEWRRRKNQTIK